MGRLQFHMEILQGNVGTWTHALVHSWHSYTRSRLALQMWMDSTGVSFVTEEARIQGRKVSYPYLLDQKGEPRLDSTNAFMIWFCERCDIVTKKSPPQQATPQF